MPPTLNWLRVHARVRSYLAAAASVSVTALARSGTAVPVVAAVDRLRVYALVWLNLAVRATEAVQANACAGVALAVLSAATLLSLFSF